MKKRERSKSDRWPLARRSVGRVSFEIQGIDHVAVTVTDLKRSIKWYSDVLGLEHRPHDIWGDVPSMICAGDTCLALFPSDDDSPAPPPDNNTIAMRHIAWRVNHEDFDAAQADLRARGIEFEFQDHVIAHSIYLHDPDGHRLEITTYEVTPRQDTDDQ
jgi:catechol 2,3-dioxygenase-like lactoylglutathione lyase family enzyme